MKEITLENSTIAILKKETETIYYEEVELDKKYRKPIDIGMTKEKFLGYFTYVLSTLTEDTSEEKVDRLVNYIGEDPVSELKEIFYNLSVKDKVIARGAFKKNSFPRVVSKPLVLMRNVFIKIQRHRGSRDIYKTVS